MSGVLLAVKMPKNELPDRHHRQVVAEVGIPAESGGRGRRVGEGMGSERREVVAREFECRLPVLVGRVSGHLLVEEAEPPVLVDRERRVGRVGDAADRRRPVGAGIRGFRDEQRLRAALEVRPADEYGCAVARIDRDREVAAEALLSDAGSAERVADVLRDANGPASRRCRSAR